MDKTIYFGIGLPKTGLTSLTKAFRIMGFNTVQYPKNGQLNRIERADFMDDLPIPSRYVQYSSTYPASKFILTTRDLDEWLPSCERHWGRIRYGQRLRNRLMETFGSIHFEKELFIKVYNDHMSSVIDFFKDQPDRLLVLNICGGEGWDKLCPFVGKDIPAEHPFPWEYKSSK